MIQDNSGFWDSIDAAPGDDGDERNFNADEITVPFEYLVTDGIQIGGEFLQVAPGPYGYTTQINPGMAWIGGRWYKLWDDQTGGIDKKVMLHDAPLQYSRIDRIVLRKNKNYTLDGRYIRPYVLKGVEAEQPVPPELTRDEEIHEKSLAMVRVNPGMPTIQELDITDERFDRDLCGIAEFAPQPDLQPKIDEFLLLLEQYKQQMGEGGLDAALVSTVPPAGRPALTSAQAYLDAIAAKEYTITLAVDGWSTEAPYTQTVTVPGITTPSTRPIADVLLSDDPEVAAEEANNWGSIGRIDVGDGSVTATCYDSAPDVDITCTIKEVG